MRRQLFYLASTVSLLIFLATGISCAWSYHRGIDAGAKLSWSSGNGKSHGVECEVKVDRGLLMFDGSLLTAASPLPVPARPFYFDYDERLRPGYHFIPDNPPGFKFSPYTVRSQIRSETSVLLITPGWAPLLLTAILPALRIARYYRRRASQRENRCKSCDYNLTGNTSGVCPECGTAVPAKAEATA